MKIKTKTNLKRALLFFIPLCLIAGMLAVPAFAVVQVTWKDVDATTTLEPTTLAGYYNYPDYSSKSTAGMYALTFDNLKSDIQELDPSSEINIFPNFTGVGYLEVDYGSSVQYFVFGTGLRANGDDITVGIGYDYNHEDFAVFVDPHDNGAAYPVFVGGATCTFYFSQYPPVSITGTYSDAQYFWDNCATYNVYMVSSTTPDPEPPSGGDDEGGEGETSGIIAVWTQITDWIINGLKSATNAFYYNGQLTLLGYLCIIPLALGVALLLISIIQKFLRLRG